MKTKFIFPLFMILLPSFFTTALKAQDSKAQGILISAYQNYRSYENIKIQFVSTTDNPSRNFHQSFEGVAFVKGLNHVIQLEDKEIISDGKTIWTYQKNSKKLFISNYNPEDHRITPDEVFREDFLRQGLVYKYINKETPQGGAPAPAIRPEHIIEFIPKRNDRNYLKFRLYIDETSKLLNHWKVFLKNGSTTDYQMRISPNQELKDSFFKYYSGRYPSGTQIVDLRRK